MGIKLHCPNGHKLNVKSFLAGKKGVCPHCGASFRIPGDKPADDAGDEASEPAPSLAFVHPTATPAVATPALPISAIPAAPVGSAPLAVAASVRPAIAQGVLPAAPAVPLPPAVATAAPAAIDPISEAPAAAWYVRPPSGGQFGPARGDVMRKWIAEGRVSSDSLVWREGWTDWRNAGGLFPTLAAAGSALSADSAAATPSIASTPRITRASSSPAAARRGSGLAIAIVVSLALLCIGLVVALVFVLGGMK